MKTCTKCSFEGLDDLFKKGRSVCKPCAAAKSKADRAARPEVAAAYRLEKAETLRAKGRARYATNAESERERNRAYRSENREVLRVKRAEKHATNIEMERARRRAKYIANPEAAADYTRRWALANPEKRAAMNKAWRSANPAADRAKDAKRRASVLQRTPKWLTSEHFDQIKAIYAECARLTEETGVLHHVDHDVPLQGKNVSGLHCPWNLRVIPASENLAKKNRYTGPDSWAA